MLVPDLAGWRLDRLPRLPDEAYCSVAPDWICEGLSPSTAALDRVKKLAAYARERASHVWLVDPIAQTIEGAAARERAVDHRVHLRRIRRCARGAVRGDRSGSRAALGNSMTGRKQY